MNNTMNEDSESSSSEEDEEEEEIRDKKKRNSRGPGRPKKEVKVGINLDRGWKLVLLKKSYFILFFTGISLSGRW